jgi:hypothetical protein
MVCELAWRPETVSPTAAGWYEVDAIDGRFADRQGPVYRAWGNGRWWTPLADGWISVPDGLYRWRGPVADVNGPAPDGTNPQ